MIIIPAIDLIDGKCVRLTQGRFDQEVVYGDPRDIAKLWASQGAKYLHLVDLDAARTGSSKNGKVIRDIVASIPIPVQVGGGVRSIHVINRLLAAGVSRVILGSSAVTDRAFILRAVEMFQDRVMVSVDALDGSVALRGWTKLSPVKALDLAMDLEVLGVKTIVYTDIAKDGMMGGPNFEELKTMRDNLGLNIIASGGIRAEDIFRLRELKLAGAIVGKALLNGSTSLEELELMST